MSTAPWSPKLLRIGFSRLSRVPHRVHAVRDDTGRALCSQTSPRGWNDTTQTAVTCPHCLLRLPQGRASP